VCVGVGKLGHLGGGSPSTRSSVSGRLRGLSAPAGPAPARSPISDPCGPCPGRASSSGAETVLDRGAHCGQQSRATSVTVLPEDRANATASRLNSSEYRFPCLLLTWLYFLWDLTSQFPGVQVHGEASARSSSSATRAALATPPSSVRRPHVSAAGRIVRGGSNCARMQHDRSVDNDAISGLCTSLSELSYAMAGSHAHSRLRREADVPKDRASPALLRTLAGSSRPLRAGELRAS
jgi:hypothetical protein